MEDEGIFMMETSTSISIHDIVSTEKGAKYSTWKYRIMVHINPRTMEGRPSAISVELMLTNLICSKRKTVLVMY